MSSTSNRRTFIKNSLLGSSTALSLSAMAEKKAADGSPTPDPLEQGDINGLKLSRMILGGNLLTHFTHSRDLKYVYNLAAQYNTKQKILDTMSIAEKCGVNTLNIHYVPETHRILVKHRMNGGKMQWIICPTAPVDDDLNAYEEQIKLLVGDGADALYLWGVHADQLVSKGRMDLIERIVELMHQQNVPAGIGGHDLNVVVECEKHQIPLDFYIKTFHHHNYPTGPKPEELKGPYSEIPGYWCKDPNETVEIMSKVEKPWIAFKVMAAGAIPPLDAFQHAFNNGADHILAGMFDFEIEEDAKIMREVLPKVERTRPWYS